MRPARKAVQALRAVLAVVTTLVVATAVAPPSLAHDGDAGLVVEPASTSPGGSVTVRGDLPTTSDLDLVLVGPTGRKVPVGRVTDPPNGHFEVAVTVPSAAAAGTWTVEAVSGGEHLVSASLAVSGAAPADVAGGALDPNGQDEPVAVPPALRPTAMPARTPAADTSTGPGVAWAVGVGVALAATIGAGLVLNGRRRGQASTREPARVATRTEDRDPP